MIRTVFRTQADICSTLGSPMMAKLLRVIADRMNRSTRVGRNLLDWQGDPVADALPLRLAGALHALVLADRSPELVELYPDQILSLDDSDLWLAIDTAFRSCERSILAFLESPPQTNEVGRSAVLAAGFLTIARATGQPLTILELGASAGLNLHWDGFAYDLGGVHLGPDDHGLLLAPDWQGPPPPVASIDIQERAGCDRSPIDPASPEQALRLRAYVWADQRDRLHRLDHALAHAKTSGVRVEHADAADWTERQMESRRPGVATVLFHSIMWQYLDRDRQDRIVAALHKRGEQAGADAPLAWLRMEPDTTEAAELRLTLWPGPHTHRLAEVDYHGRWIRWADTPAGLDERFGRS